MNLRINTQPDVITCSMPSQDSSCVILNMLDFVQC